MVVKGDTVRRQVVRVIDWPSQRIVVLDGVTLGDTLALNPKAVRAGLAVRTKPTADAL